MITYKSIAVINTWGDTDGIWDTETVEPEQYFSLYQKNPMIGDHMITNHFIQYTHFLVELKYLYL